MVTYSKEDPEYWLDLEVRKTSDGIANLAQAAVGAGITQLRRSIEDGGYTREQVQEVLDVWDVVDEERGLLWSVLWEMDGEEAW